MSFFADLHFLAVADWGGLPVWPWSSPAQRRVAHAMGAVAEMHDTAFALSLGDHFYFNGVRSVDDPRFQRTFEDVYDSPALHGEGFWRMVGGNHDHDGNISAQLAYAAHPGSRWHYPELQYTFRSVLSDEFGTTLDFVLIDTQLLCGMPNDKPLPAGGAEDAWRWVEETLAASDADFLVVGGHYPVYSPSGHGGTHCLRQRLEPLLERSRASIYLSGHDHAQFHVGDVVAGPQSTQYHGVGAGFVTSCSAKHRHTIPANQLRFFRRGRRPSNLVSGGFAGLSVSATGLTVSHYDEQGEVVHQSTVRPRARV